MNLDNDFNQENENITEEVEQEVQEEQEEIEQEVQEEQEEIEQEVQEEIEQEVQSDRNTQSEVLVDYKQDFIILQNLGYIQVVLTGFILFYFVFSLVYKYIKSFF